MKLVGLTLASVGKDMAQLVISYTAGEIINPSLWKTVWRYPLTLEIFLPMTQPHTPLLSMCPTNLCACTPRTEFTATLFINAKIRKYHEWPPTEQNNTFLSQNGTLISKNERATMVDNSMDEFYKQEVELEKPDKRISALWLQYHKIYIR